MIMAIRSFGIGAVTTVLSFVSVGAVTILPAQTIQVSRPTDRNDDDTTIAGCLFLGPHGDYVLTTTEIKPAAKSGVAVGTSGSTEELRTRDGTPAQVTAWKLEGQPRVDDGLLPYLLQKIEITGQPVPAASGTTGAVSTSGIVGAAGSDKPTQYLFKVKSIKRLSMDACS
jgi:hypothetical protein